MTPADRERIRQLVQETCATQGIPIVVPAEVAADVARLLPPVVEGGGRAPAA